jgi:hypothetical protein
MRFSAFGAFTSLAEVWCFDLHLSSYFDAYVGKQPQLFGGDLGRMWPCFATLTFGGGGL